MKVLVLAGLITAATAPFAMAAENEIECQVGETRRASAQERMDPPPVAPATVARPTVAQREADVAPRPAAPPERRRNGKRVPDAELISPRGVL